MANIPSTRALTVSTDGSDTNAVFNVDAVNKIISTLNGASFKMYSDAYTTVVMQIIGGLLGLAQSAAAPAIANAGTIATAGLGVSRVAPAAARTGIIMAAGTIPGQLCLVVNESAAANSITFDVSGTSNVADGVNDVIPGLTARLYVWDSVQSLWFPIGSMTTGGTIDLAQSATAATIANAGTITTAGLGVSRVAPAAARTGIIMQAGTIPGQLCLVINESAVANSLTFDVSGTSNVADGVNNVIYGQQAKAFVWDSSTSLWYGVSITTNGTLAPAQSSTAPAIANAGTIATAGVGVSRVNPASAVTGIIIAAGTIPGQLCFVVNEAAVGNSLTFNTTPGTSNVADSATEAPIPGLQSRLFVWDSSAALWYPVGNPLANGTYVSIQSATAPDPGGAGTITTAGVGVARVSPAAARSGIILQAGTYPGQEVTVVNEATAANTLTFNTTPATSNVADSATEANIPGLTARSFVWDSSTSLWYRQN